jgi:3-methyl-2-oxobutanoate hydroxymethyltransferase
MNISQLKTFKKHKQKIACLTAYDSSFAELFDECGLDIILVGDSLGNVIKGDKNTLKVTIENMIYHTNIVASKVKNSLLVVDMPYKSYTNANQTLINANKLIKAGAKIVKLEGFIECEESFKILQDNKIPVCGHLGLQPQSTKRVDDYKMQGKNDVSANKIIEQAKLLEEYGAKVIVLEFIPSKLAKKISNILSIPTIGIGAGVDCDGQVLVSYDMLGITKNPPKFVKNFLIDSKDIKAATKNYIDAVKNGLFP